MTKLTPQTKDPTADAAWESGELSDEELEDVRGGAEFLRGALTTQEVATPSLNTDNSNGFTMKDTVIIRTGR